MSLTPIVEYESLEKFNKPFVQDFNKAYKTFIKSGWYILGEQVCQTVKARALGSLAIEALYKRF